LGQAAKSGLGRWLRRALWLAKYPPFCTFKWAVAALAGTAQNC
jgi:hypothetical protein